MSGAEALDQVLEIASAKGDMRFDDRVAARAELAHLRAVVEAAREVAKDEGLPDDHPLCVALAAREE